MQFSPNISACKGGKQCEANLQEESARILGAWGDSCFMLPRVTITNRSYRNYRACYSSSSRVYDRNLVQMGQLQTTYRLAWSTIDPTGKLYKGCDAHLQIRVTILMHRDEISELRSNKQPGYTMLQAHCCTYSITFKLSTDCDKVNT